MRINKPTLFMARFFADASCSTQFRATSGGPPVDGYCSVKILVAPEGGEFVEMDPTTAAFEEFQVNGGTAANAIERSFIAEKRGLYTVKVQFSMPFGFDPNDPAEAPFSVNFSTFTLTAWHLTLDGAVLLGDQ
jgi:hypothetical protein